MWRQILRLEPLESLTLLSFLAPVSYNTGGPPVAVVAADLNGDGVTDLVTGNSTGTVSVLLGNGGGSFQAPVTSSFGAYGVVTSLAVGDFNGDGIPDLAVISSGDLRHAGTLTVLLGNGDGSFRTSFTRLLGVFGLRNTVVVGDFNGDNQPDLVVPYLDSADSMSVLLGNGDGSFQAPQDYAVGGAYASLAVADLNHDNRLDIVVASVSNSVQLDVRILLGNGDGSFQDPQTILSQPTTYLYPSLAVGDLNGDGNPDLVVVSHDVLVLLGNGDGTFQPAVNAFPGSFITSVGIADFNQDGVPDLAVGFAGGNGPAGVGVLLGNGDGTFQPTFVSYGASASVGAVADLNGDGFPDVVTPNVTPSAPSFTVSVLLNAADWSGGPHVVPPRSTHRTTTGGHVRHASGGELGVVRALAENDLPLAARPAPAAAAATPRSVQPHLAAPAADAFFATAIHGGRRSALTRPDPVWWKGSFPGVLADIEVALLPGSPEEVPGV